MTIFRAGRLYVGLLLLSAGALTFAGAARAGGKTSKIRVSAADRAQADELFSSRCATCHGEEGAGDGPAAESMNPRPRNFQDPAWQKSVSNATIAKAIVGGGPAVGLSSEMAPNPDLEDQAAAVMALVEKIRQFRK